MNRVSCLAWPGLGFGIFNLGLARFFGYLYFIMNLIKLFIILLIMNWDGWA